METETNQTELELEPQAEQPAAVETPTETAPSAPSVITDGKLAEMLAEAEQRGYLRGRNEQISLAMQAPSLWHEGATTDPADEPRPTVLANLRPSIWD